MRDEFGEPGEPVRDLTSRIRMFMMRVNRLAKLLLGLVKIDN